ncbi:hypothetical protein CTAYLR_009361 [Chrysophaeum taylorii]|uniref:Uncharacterized protein n=1 Tax=Chrysophaeum taylorii TaxID=2483200 RepID=A0AAD7UJ37_9STRA|nr:hypothetical protein CTAYLR_009361 [Chrysophaeum taylorii]
MAEFAFVQKALTLREKRGSRKRCNEYEGLVAQVRAGDVGLEAEEVAMKGALMFAIARLGQRVATGHASLVEALFACQSTTPVVVEGLAAALASVVASRATLVGKAFGTLLRVGATCDATNPVIKGLFALIELCPLGMSELLVAARRNYPWSGAPGKHHARYARVLLALGERHALLEAFVLQLVVERALALDVEVDISDLWRGQSPKKRPEQPNSSEGRRGGDDDVFQLEMEGSNPKSVSPPGEEMMAQEGEDDDSSAGKLDGVMCLVMAYVAARVAPNADARAKDAFVAVTLNVFESAILNTHESKFVQFFVFFVCASSAERSARFASRLSNVVADDSAPHVSRLGAVAYLASFVCRAKSVDADLAAWCTEQLFRSAEDHAAAIWGGAGAGVGAGAGANWGASPSASPRSLDGQPMAVSLPTSPHSLKAAAAAAVDSSLASSAAASVIDPKESNPPVFYALFQALLYVVCFRGDELLSSRSSEQRGESLADAARWENLLAVGNGDGLRRCDPRILAEFCDVCERVQGLFSSDFLLALRALSHLSTTDNGSSNGAAAAAAAAVAAHKPSVARKAPSDDDRAPLDKEFFFPFDPYLLPRSRSYIAALYRDWSDVHDDNNDAADLEDQHPRSGCDAATPQSLRSPDGRLSSLAAAATKQSSSPASLSMSVEQDSSVRPPARRASTTTSAYPRKTRSRCFDDW